MITFLYNLEFSLEAMFISSQNFHKTLNISNAKNTNQIVLTNTIFIHLNIFVGVLCYMLPCFSPPIFFFTLPSPKSVFSLHIRIHFSYNRLFTSIFFSHLDKSGWYIILISTVLQAQNSTYIEAIHFDV